MKNKIVLLLLISLLIQFSVCSCTRITVDPFLTETETAAEATAAATAPAGLAHFDK